MLLINKAMSSFLKFSDKRVSKYGTDENVRIPTWVCSSDTWKASRIPVMNDLIFCQPSFETASEESTAKTRSRLWLQAEEERRRRMS